MVVYANGAIPQAAMHPIPAIGGTAWLLPGPAAAFHQVIGECERRYGWSPVVTSAGDGFRSLARQVAVFRQRYEPLATGRGPYGDVRWWNGVRYVRVRGAAAAVPGTSNHGKGITVDVSGLGAFTSTRYRQFKDIAERHGWSNAEGRSVGEPWHWNYTHDAYEVVNTNTIPGVDIVLPGGVLPGDLIERDWFDMATEEDLRRIVAEEVSRLLPIALENERPNLTKPMLDQANKAVAPVLDAIKALPDAADKILRYRVPGIVEGSASEFPILARDARVAATTARDLLIQIRDILRPAPTPEPTEVGSDG